MAYDSGTNRSIWGFFTGADYAVDPSTESASAALERYKTHLTDLQNKKRWPPALVAALIDNANSIQNRASAMSFLTGAPSADDFWISVAESEPGVYAAQGIEPGSLQKIDSHIAFLNAWGAAARSLQSAVDAYDPVSFTSEVASESAQDFAQAVRTGGEALNPKKSPWPWVIGGVTVLLLLRELK
jgi:hypothetical protein